MVVCLYILFRWLTDYRKCTISYIEIKVRGVKKEQGYLYRFLNSIFDTNCRDDRFFWYFLYSFIIVMNAIKIYR